jgi:hypothetical protein
MATTLDVAATGEWVAGHRVAAKDDPRLDSGPIGAATQVGTSSAQRMKPPPLMSNVAPVTYPASSPTR